MYKNKQLIYYINIFLNDQKINKLTKLNINYPVNNVF